MLRIEKVFLQGFKSFCDPTEIVLDEEGITAVVGPNGCGKSNVADAISWVIGEQRPKALRGGKMEDVIFQGSRNRQPSGMAEVLLTMVVHETFEIRTDVKQPETEALQQAEESLEQADAAFEAIEPEPETETEPETEPESLQEEQPEKKQIRRRRRHIEGAPRIFQEGERITVGRRLYRTGESEYEMNGRSCRLRDVQDLFAGTGLGAAHYAIIEQGRIGQVLSAKPMDRRALIEEAAGISKFKMRQHAAQLKLEASKNNLSRITDILSEIERQQNSLKRQASKARRYKRLKQEMRDLMRAVYVVDYRTTRESISILEKSLDEIVALSAELSKSINELDESQAEAVRLARVAEEALNEARQSASTVDIEAERARQQHTHLNEQLESLGSRAGQYARDQAAIGERRRFIDQETARLREQLSALEQEINTASRTLAEAEESHKVQLEKDAETEKRLEEARAKVYECVTQLERWRQLNRQFTDSVERSKERLQGLEVELERAQAQAQKAGEEHSRLTASLDESTTQQNRIYSELTEIRNTIENRRVSLEQRETRAQQLQRDLTATEHRLQSLKELDQRRAYFSEAVQALMNRDGGLNGFRTMGTLADFVQVSPENEAMIEIALRDELQYVVVPTFDDALGAIDFLKQEGAGRATFLVVGLHGANQYMQDIGDSNGTLASLLGLRPEFAEAFNLALPGLANARIVEDTSQAIRVSVSSNGSSGNGHHEDGYKALTTLALTGERVSAGRLISGGSRSEKSMGLLALKREIVELEEKMQSLSMSVNASEAELERFRVEISGFEESQKRLDGELRQVEKQLAVLREQMQQCERERERTSSHIRVVEQEMNQAGEELRDFEGKLSHASEQMAGAEQSRAEADKAIEITQAEVTELRNNAETRSQELSKRRAEFAARTERRRGLQNDINRLQSEASDLDNRLNISRMEAIEADEKTATTQATIVSTAERLELLTSRQQTSSSDLELKNQTLAAAREKAEAIERRLRTQRDAAVQTREDRAQKEIELTKLTSNLEHLVHSCHTELGENIVEVCERLDRQPVTTETEEETDIVFWNVPEDFNLEESKTNLDDIRAKIDSLGPVNMMALEELVEVEERFQFLTLQKADIEKAITDTQAAIAEIKRRSRERFREAFAAINDNFQQMFIELFGGGHGEMRLIDETDILESGIEIIAQPPGKRLQNVLLLSGGEKAMTAIALVMAIFKYRPSPFCLLDEVDAPLDEVNIGRFADKVVEMSSATQFVIITHNKKTMESANTLYGVTMEDPGVSKLISVKLT